MKDCNIIFPHQLFETNEIHQNGHPIYLIEEYLFFKEFKFHKRKLAYHRATMKMFENHLQSKGCEVHYIESRNDLSDIRLLIKKLAENNCEEIHYIDPCDDWLTQRIKQSAHDTGIVLHEGASDLFINTKEDLLSFFKKDKKSFLHHNFYKLQRKKYNILLSPEGDPKGGKWSFDEDNRKKYPKDKTPPSIEFEQSNDFWKEAVTYVEKHFANNYGELNDEPIYPTTYKAAQQWLNDFLNNRLDEFGTYEDAIVRRESFLHHSVITPILNIGLLSPKEVINQTIAIARKKDIPMNSLEGFIRQVIGWREFMRGMYEAKGRFARTKNYWGFTRKIPACFYSGETGIPPIDETIKKTLKTGYCHHIERLMVLGNFMLLCEFDPDEVYTWFMELFIDAYDWVMVPNVYGMSQFADGGLLATKPYISSSNYILKMSDYSRGDWQTVWDGLFWRFMHHQRDFFSSNPRIGMLLKTWDKMSEEKRSAHLANATVFLENLDAQE